MDARRIYGPDELTAGVPLTSAIAAAGWTPETLAARLDLGLNTVLRWCSGGAGPSIGVRRRIAKALTEPPPRSSRSAGARADAEHPDPPPVTRASLQPPGDVTRVRLGNERVRTFHEDGRGTFALTLTRNGRVVKQRIAG